MYRICQAHQETLLLPLPLLPMPDLIGHKLPSRQHNSLLLSDDRQVARCDELRGQKASNKVIKRELLFYQPAYLQVKVWTLCDNHKGVEGHAMQTPTHHKADALGPLEERPPYVHQVRRPNLADCGGG